MKNTELFNGTEYINFSKENSNMLLNAISKLYYIFYDIDIVNDTFTKYHATELVSEYTDSISSAKQCLASVPNVMFKATHQKALLDFFDMDTWQQRFLKKDTAYLEAEGVINGWIRINLIVTSRDDAGLPTHVSLAIQNINEFKLREIEQAKNLQNMAVQNEQLRLEQIYNEKETKIINALSSSYLNVYLIDSVAKTIEVIKLDGYATIGFDKSKKTVYPYDVACNNYIATRVYKDDIAFVEEAMRLENVLNELDENDFYEFTYRVLENDTIHYYQGKYYRIADGSIVCGFQNIDDILAKEKARNEELENAKLSAEVANNAKTNFLFNMSHDIRTPMNAILGYATLLEGKIDDRDTVLDYVSKIQGAGQYLLSIINNILDMARIESGKLELENAPLDFLKDVGYVTQLFEDTVKRKNITLSRKVNITNRYVISDATRIREVAVNILSNAVKYTPDNGSISTEFNQLPCDKEGYATYEYIVTDTGIGMSKEFLEHIFEPFTREHTTTQSKVVGTGLGMAIVKRLLDLFGGDIKIESEPGKGSRFAITLTLQLADNVKPQVEVEEEPDVSCLDGCRVLLAEDNDLNAEITVSLLENFGIVLERACDGLECVNMLHDAPTDYYDLILMDIQMPNLDGYGATRRIRAFDDDKKANIPILALTANAFKEDVDNSLSVGMNGHLSKPIDLKQLLSELVKIVK